MNGLPLVLMGILACSKPRPVCADENTALVANDECWPIAGAEDSDPAPAETGDTAEEPVADPEEEALDTVGLDKVKVVFSDAVGMIRVGIPEELNDPSDVELGNTEVQTVVDERGEVLGYVRSIFTPVYCGAGVCEAVKFDMAFGPDGLQRAVYHPGGMQFLLMKYIDGTYDPFDDADMALLNSLFVAPPDLYAPVESAEDLVDGAYGSAPTLPEFQPLTVRGAVFTVWYIVQYGAVTREVLNEMALVGGGT